MLAPTETDPPWAVEEHRKQAHSTQKQVGLRYNCMGRSRIGPWASLACPSLFRVRQHLSKHPFPNREPTRRRFLDSPPDSLLFLAVGGLYGADVLGEQQIRWVMYISSSVRVVLPSLGLEFLPAELSTVSFCPFRSFSTIACVCGERVL